MQLTETHLTIEKMKKIFIWLILLMPAALFAQNRLIKSEPKDTVINNLLKQIGNIDDMTNRLSSLISKLPSDNPLNDITSNEIRVEYGHILDSLKKLSLKQLIDSLRTEKDNFNSQFYNFKLQDSIMNNTLFSFSAYTKYKLYAAQIDYAVTTVNRFLTTIGIFKQYVQSLIKVTPEDLLKKIKTLTDSTDTMVAANKKHIDSLITYNEQQIPRIKKRIEKVQRKTDTIINMLKRGTLFINQYLTGAAYTDNVFGISYLLRIGSAKPVIPGNFWGLEFIMPISSVSVKNPGGFLLYGLRDDKILIEAGAGYLKTNMSREDVSWKAGLLYLPKKFGIGLSYSPLTNIGLQLAYNL